MQKLTKLVACNQLLVQGFRVQGFHVAGYGLRVDTLVLRCLIHFCSSLTSEALNVEPRNQATDGRKRISKVDYQ